MPDFLFAKRNGKAKTGSMSVEQLESAILELSPEERRRLVAWLDDHRNELFSGAVAPEADLTEEQRVEIRRRRQEYREHPEQFIRVDERSLEEIFGRIRNACARVSSTR